MSQDAFEIVELDDQSLEDVAGGVTDTNNCSCTNNCGGGSTGGGGGMNMNCTTETF